MTTLTLQQAFEACQKNETDWLNRKAELAAAEQEYREQVLAGVTVFRAECRHCATLSMSKMGDKSGRRALYPLP
nr:Phage polarity suppression protein (Psu) [Klebsiella pneumoniae]